MKVIRKQNSLGGNEWFLVGDSDIMWAPAVVVMEKIEFNSEFLTYFATQGDVFRKDTIPQIIIDKFGEKFKPLLASSDSKYAELGIMITSDEQFVKASGESTIDLVDLLKKCRVELEGKEIANDLDAYIKKAEGSFGLRYSATETIDILESFKTAAQSGKILQWVSHNVKVHVCDVWNCEAKITGSNIEILSLKSANN